MSRQPMRDSRTSRTNFAQLEQHDEQRVRLTTDADSGTVKDANGYAKDTMKDSRYPLSLLLRVITVSLETVKIVRALPPINDAAPARENQAFAGQKKSPAVEYGQQELKLPMAAEVGE